MSTSITHRHTEIIAATVALAGRRVLEIGCGGGRLLRWLSRRAAVTIGLDPAAAQVAHARDAAPDAALLVGRGEQLPFRAAAFDLALCFNSLHHVPATAQPVALAEIRRVLDPGGQLLVIEPAAAGPWFEFLRPVEDEAEVRSRTQERLGAAKQYGFEVEEARSYDSAVIERDLEGALARILAANPARAARLTTLRPELAQAFDDLGSRSDDGWSFRQPMHLHLLRPLA